jgi:hypothetical protein
MQKSVPQYLTDWMRTKSFKFWGLVKEFYLKCYTVLILGTSPYDRFSSVRAEQKVRCGILKTNERASEAKLLTNDIQSLVQIFRNELSAHVVG